MAGLLDKKDIATLLSVTPRTINKMLVDGMPAYRCRNVLRFDLDEVKKWLKENHLKRNSEGSLIK